MTTNYYELLCQEDLNLGVSTTTKRNPGGGTLPATQIGLHTFATGQRGYLSAWAPGTINSLGRASTTVNIPGANPNCVALATISTALQGCILTAEVSSSGVVTISLFNPTTAPIVFTSTSLQVVVFNLIAL